MKALVSDRTPEKFYTDPKAADGNTCVACHTLSRDGKRLAVNYGGEKLKEVAVPARTAIVPPTGNPTREGGWSTFSPDGKQILIATKGVLTLLDADTGAPVGANAGQSDGTYPSPPTATCARSATRAATERIAKSPATSESFS